MTTVNAYVKAVELGLTGSDEEITAQLVAIGNTDITRLALGKFLREGNFLIYDGTAWYGSVQTLMNMSLSPIPAEHIPNIIALKSIITGSGGDGLATTKPVWAVQILSFVSLLATIAGNIGLVDAFYEMAGGRPYKDLTPEDYALQKAAYEADQAQAEALATLNNKVQQWKNRLTMAPQEFKDGFRAEAIAEVEAVVAEMKAF